MKKFVALLFLISMGTTWTTKFEFQKSENLPAIEIKVDTENKRTETKKVAADKKELVGIDVRGGDEIAVLTVKKECTKKLFCEEIDEIYIAYPKPGEAKARERNKSTSYIEKIRRYDAPNLRGVKKFKISPGFGVVGFFQVDALD